MSKHTKTKAGDYDLLIADSRGSDGVEVRAFTAGQYLGCLFVHNPRAAFDGRGVVHRGFPAWLKEDGEKLTLLYWAYEGYEERHHRLETHASKP